MPMELIESNKTNFVSQDLIKMKMDTSNKQIKHSIASDTGRVGGIIESGLIKKFYLCIV